MKPTKLNVFYNYKLFSELLSILVSVVLVNLVDSIVGLLQRQTLSRVENPAGQHDPVVELARAVVQEAISRQVPLLLNHIVLEICQHVALIDFIALFWMQPDAEHFPECDAHAPHVGLAREATLAPQTLRRAPAR